MQRGFQKAFTMIELTFVIVVIGILAAIALPRFGDTADSAYLSKAQSQLMAVRSALSTERQKRILRGDTSAITSLSCTSSSCPATPTNVFDHFSADQDGNYTAVMNYPVSACNSGQKACWKVDTSGSNITYSYQFIEGGEAVFVLDKNRLDCQSGDETDCKKITQ
jgi:general secretion pathway protein G